MLEKKSRKEEKKIIIYVTSKDLWTMYTYV
jgi:hypothetical protein